MTSSSGTLRRKDGFEGEKLISLPPGIWPELTQKHPALFQLYISHIGYFPKAQFHYRERRNGCEDNILIYCLQGKGHYIVDGRTFEVTANQYILLPATDKYMRYWADHDDPWTIYWVHFTGRDVSGFNQSLQLSIHRGPIPFPYHEKAIDTWYGIYQTLEMGYSLENLAKASLQLYAFVSFFLFPERLTETNASQKADIVLDTITFMRAHLDRKLSVDEMAVQHQLSCSHFSMLFRKGTGMPPLDYFTHLKMQKACQLIYAGTLKIKDIALSLGYDDPYYFSRVFRKNMGQSPEQYRLTSRRMV